MRDFSRNLQIQIVQQTYSLGALRLIEPTIFINCSISLKQHFNLFFFFFFGQRLSFSCFENLIKVLDSSPWKMHTHSQTPCVGTSITNCLSEATPRISSVYVPWCVPWKCAKMCWLHWNVHTTHTHINDIFYIRTIKWNNVCEDTSSKVKYETADIINYAYLHWPF